MRLLELFLDVVSGRITHWIKTNNTVVARMRNRLNDLESPNEIVFKHLLLSADVFIEYLVNMGETRQRWIKIDCRKIDIEKLHRLYIVVLTYFSFVLCFVNQQVRRNHVLKESIRNSLGEITDSPEECDRILKQLSIYYSKSLNEVNMGCVDDIIWVRIAEITGFRGERLDLSRSICFRMVLEGASTDALKGIFAELNDTPKDPDEWARARAHGLDIPEEQTLLPVDDMEQHVLLEGGRYVYAYFPELMEPLRLIRRDFQAYRASGDAHRRKLEQDLAIADYTKAIEIAPEFAPAYRDRGLAYMAKAEYDLAILDFTKAIEEGARSDVGYFERGNAYTKKGEYDLAIADYTKVIGTDPSSVGGYYYRGEAYTQKGEYECAIPDFTKVIEMQPGTVLGQGAHYNLGCIYLKMGDTDSALEHYDALKRLDENLAKGLLRGIQNMAEFSSKSNQQE